MAIAYVPNGSRTIEAVEGGVVHEIYSDGTNWHDNAIPGTAGNATAVAIAYAPNGSHTIEAIE